MKAAKEPIVRDHFGGKTDDPFEWTKPQYAACLGQRQRYCFFPPPLRFQD